MQLAGTWLVVDLKVALPWRSPAVLFQRLGGTPVFKGTRVPVKTLFEYLEDMSCAIWKQPKPGTALFTMDFIVAIPGALNYLWGMSQTIERRVEELEHKLADLTAQFADVKSRQKDWRRTFGLSRGDDGFKEMNLSE